MERPRQLLRRLWFALAILCCLVFLITAPFLIEGRLADIRLKSAAVFAAASDSYSLSSPVQLLDAPRISLEQGTLSVPPNRTGLARGREVIAMLITGSGPRMTLKDATFTADFSSRQTSAVQAATVGGMAPFVAALHKLQFDSLSVRDSAIRIKLADGSILVLDNLTTDVTNKPSGLVRAVGSFTYRGEKVEFKTALETKIDPQSAASHPISVALTSPLLKAQFDGSVMLGESPQLLSPQADLMIPNVRQAARWLGAGWPPGTGFENLRVNGQLKWVNHTLAFQEANVEMDGNQAAGTLSLNFSGARPAIEGTLGLDSLDLTRYVSSANAPADVTAKSLLSKVNDASGLNFPLIQMVDADLRISSGSLILPGGSIGRSAATITLKGGKMIADIAELEIDEGTRGGGQLRIDASGPRPSYDIRGKLQALDLGRASKAIFGHPTIQGRGDLLVEVSASGNSGAALLGSLDGKMNVTLAEGGQLGIDVDELTEATAAANQHSAWQAACKSTMAVDTLSARFALEKGVIRTTAAEAVSGGRAVKANGAINLPTRRLDLELAIGEAVKTDGEGEPAKRDVIGMHGPWSKPSLRSSTAVETGTTQTPRDPG